ncbi:uncharacterized protein F5891DRAFT_978312 [Suillus fuscotomentosus]|uniref:Uncharacterized protein n=1 Tax=Suillus fuscotomentosus TaxID=1912939 RepID=A0AAD4EAZ5_9AGAM|nr:uncharacterized protein F5891DRAFT_978312 [Suillus fuscotomentosus]KAG1902840.1 hypothetical protein F5891DRAFT_978312 [Suillus fuscotomentosus]
MIGISDYRTIPLKDLYSPFLIPSLHTAVHARIGPKLGIDIDSIDHEMLGEEEIPDGQDEGQEMHSTGTAGSGVIDNGELADGMRELEEDSGDNGDADQDYEPEDNEGPDSTPYSRALAEDDSGFGDNGKPTVFTLGKFWNFVDTLLENICKVVKQEAVNNHQGTVFQYTLIKTAFWQILIEYFQEDLTDFPGNMAIPKLLTNNSPQWQTTIQNNLLWNENL